MSRERCVACGKPITLINIDKAAGRIGLRRGWVHYSRWANWSHAAIGPGTIR